MQPDPIRHGSGHQREHQERFYTSQNPVYTNENYPYEEYSKNSKGISGQRMSELRVTSASDNPKLASAQYNSYSGGVDVSQESPFKPRASVFNASHIITPQDAAQAPVLRIEVVESGKTLKEGDYLEIDAFGIRQEGLPRRGQRDGLTFFGSQQKDPKTGDPVNDFVLSEEEPGIGKRHMLIDYRADRNAYFIRDLGHGTGTFIRLDQALLLKHDYIISFGESHMVVSIHFGLQNESTCSGSRIELRFLDGPKTDQVFKFSEDEGAIKIGRMSDCQIKFESHSVSRYQCMIQCIRGNWTLKDGDGKKASTNGTWLFADDPFQLQDGMVFKAGQTLFRVSHLWRE